MTLQRLPDVFPVHHATGQCRTVQCCLAQRCNYAGLQCTHYIIFAMHCSCECETLPRCTPSRATHSSALPKSGGLANEPREGRVIGGVVAGTRGTFGLSGGAKQPEYPILRSTVRNLPKAHFPFPPSGEHGLFYSGMPRFSRIGPSVWSCSYLQGAFSGRV